MGLPGLAGADHIGITVPDLEAATRFFVDVIGCKVTFEVGPFASDDDWMQQHLGVDPRSKIDKLRMLNARTVRRSNCLNMRLRIKRKQFQTIGAGLRSRWCRHEHIDRRFGQILKPPAGGSLPKFARQNFHELIHRHIADVVGQS
jgi:catechol 2,3-dioxygenase-like lactoylglutathione lyase family enzyme